MLKLSSEELMRRYGHLFGGVITWLDKGIAPIICESCLRVIPTGEQFRVVDLAGLELNVCRSFAACERRRKEQAGG